MNIRNRLLLALCLFSALGYAYWKYAIPTHRVDISSELVMLGDLDGDNRWTANDLATLDVVFKNPFEEQTNIAWRIDMNQNGIIDQEDIEILRNSRINKLRKYVIIIDGG